MTESQDYDKSATPTPHAASHQAAGSDEIDVTGLAGQLAAEQPSTWALVSGKPSTFAPDVHAASHQATGSDEIDVTGLAGRVNMVHRGDPATYDFTRPNFTVDAAWHALDLSALVPAGTKAVLFRCTLQGPAPGAVFGIRKNGLVNAYASSFATQQGGVPYNVMLETMCDADQIIEYYASAGVWALMNLTIVHYWI